MKTYKGMKRTELLQKVVEARVQQCRKANFEKFGDNLPRMNENPKTWISLYRNYPMKSRNGQFCLVSEYERLCCKV